MDWRFASLACTLRELISGIGADIKVIPACPIISRQMHFQCKCQQIVRARESEAKQMSLLCYCYGTGIHQSAAELSARKSASAQPLLNAHIRSAWKRIEIHWFRIWGKWFCLTKSSASASLFVLRLNESRTATQSAGSQHHASTGRLEKIWPSFKFNRIH